MAQFTRRERGNLAIGGKDGLTETQREAFARFAPSLPSGCLSWTPDAILFGPFCGVLRAGDVTVELLPKIARADDMARGVLIAMLRATGRLTVSIAGESELALQKLHLLDQFILDFCQRINTALKEGIIVTYRTHEGNLQAIRGRFHLAQHLRVNLTDQSRLFCNYDERSVDNQYNQVLKAVLVALRRIAIGIQTKVTVGSILHRLDEVSYRPTNVEEILRLTFDRTIRHWQTIFDRAKWLLQGLFPDVRTGLAEGICLLFNMEQLFEEFIGAKVRNAWREFKQSRFVVALQGPRKEVAATEGVNSFFLRPDISISTEGVHVAILDTKWKELELKKDDLGVSNTDIYQIATYASRYGCSRVGLIYPSEKSTLLKTYILKIPNAPILEIHTVDIAALAHGKSLPPGLLPRTTLSAGA
jgi:5-methylcytosine-specific restriction enzyme subunit McrC